MRRHNKHWTDAEVNKLRLLVGHEPIERVARLLGRTDDTCRRRVQEFGGLTRGHGLLTTRTLAERCGRCQATVRNWCRSGHFPTARTSAGLRGHWLVDPDDFDEWLETYNPPPNQYGDWRPDGGKLT